MAGFKELHDLDSSTTFCPCGAPIERSDARYCDPAVFIAWKAEHAGHVDTDKVAHAIKDDGMRVCADDTKRTWVDDPDDVREAPDPDAAQRWYTEMMGMLGFVVVASAALSRSDLLDVKPPASVTAFGKVARCFRCHASPLSAQEIQNGWLCQACSVGAAEQMEACLEILANAGGTVFRDADADLKIDDNGDLFDVRSVDLASEFANYRERSDDILEPSLPATTLASIDRALAEEPKPGAIRLVEVGPRTATLPCAACGAPSTGSAVEDPAHWSTAQWRPWCGSAECRDRIRSAKSAAIPAESLARIKRDIAGGLLDGKAARAALSRMIYVQHDLKHGPGGTGRNGPCDTDCVKCAAEEEIRRVPVSIQVDKSPPAPVFGTLATLPLEVVYPETAPYLMNLRNLSCSDKTRLEAIQWLRLNGYESIAAVKAECDRVHDEIQLARLERAGALPVGKAPQCGHQAITHGCPTCAILREHLARVGVERAARILMADVDPADVDDLRRQFGLSTPPESLSDAWSPEAMQRYNKQDRERLQQALARHTTFEAAPPPRPDGFSQSAVDVAKAVLLTPVAPKGGRK